MAEIQKNFDLDYGGNGNGAGNNDNAQEFRAFRDAMVAAQGSDSVTLSLTDAAVYWFGTNGGPSNNGFMNGINDFTLDGNGATLTSSGGWGFSLGGKGQYQDASHSAMIETVAAGSRRLQLVAAHLSKASLFVVGRFICVTGCDIQGLWNSPYGFPSNQAFHDLVKILDVNATTGVIIIDRPLRNSYKSTWPRYNSGNAFEVDNGGPATIYAFDATYDARNTLKSVTLTQPAAQINGNVREINLQDVTCPGSGIRGSIPSQNLVYRAKRTDFDLSSIEVDKLGGTTLYDQCTIRRLDYQSSSIDTAVLLATDVSLFLDGTPKKAILRGRKANGSRSSIAALWPGCWAYGCSDEVDVEGYDIASFAPGGHSVTIGAGWTMTDGVIRIPNTDITGAAPASGVFVPGKYFFWKRTTSPNIFSVARGGKVLDITQDATYIYVQTNLIGGFPPNASSVKSHPCPRFRARDCIGNADILDLCQAPEFDPLYTYTFQSYTPTVQGSLTRGITWGDVASCKVNVTSAAVGSGTSSLNLWTQFSSVSLLIAEDHSLVTWFPVINLKTAGERIITPSGVTFNGSPGSGSGDTNLTMPAAPLWNGTSTGFGFYNKSGTITSGPTFTVEIKTDQGFDADDTEPAFKSVYGKF